MRRWAECEKGRDRALEWEEGDSKRSEERSVRAGKRTVSVGTWSEGRRAAQMLAGILALNERCIANTHAHMCVFKYCGVEL